MFLEPPVIYGSRNNQSVEVTVQGWKGRARLDNSFQLLTFETKVTFRKRSLYE